MIEFRNLESSVPYARFKEIYDSAFLKNQKNIEAIVISSFNSTKKEVESRFVNLKYIDENRWIFFSNYNSPKAAAFKSHKQIAALIYWQSINVQIRMKADIKKTTNEFNQKYFSDRAEHKNALAISSNQSKPIESFAKVKKNYKQSLKNDDLKKCPEYWGGYLFTPYYFEFWEGNESRINKREVFNKVDHIWEHSFLQP